MAVRVLLWSSLGLSAAAGWLAGSDVLDVADFGWYQRLMVAILFCFSGLVAMAILSSVHGDPRRRGDIFHGGLWISG
jgi:hypothetical protein